MSRGGLSANEKEGQNTSNDNKQLLDEVEHDIMNYQNRGQITQTRGFDNS